jgi:Protein of unknown function (DUF2949)
MSAFKQAKFLCFLEDELAIPFDAIALALRQCAPMANLLPMSLWQNGLITLDQLAQIFYWLETA